MMNLLNCPSCHAEGSLSKLEDKFFDYDAVHWIILKCRNCQKILVKQYQLTDVITCKQKVVLFDEENMPVELKASLMKYRNAAKKALFNLHEIN